MKNVNKNLHISAIRAAFPKTLPIMAGFIFLGMSYGILITSKGFSLLIPIATSLFVFAGSLEFALVGLLAGAFNPIETFLLALMINARHLFYGISMLEKYRGLGKYKLYMIFALCDETFSLNYSSEPPEGVDRGLYMLYTSILDHSYWILGATLGGIFGSVISFNIVGIDFAMTAMFVVILLEQLLKGIKNLPAVLIGVSLSVLSLLIFGPSDFIIPAMVMMLLALLSLAKPIDSLYKKAEEEGK